MWIEKDILPALAGTGRARVYHTKNWWSQVKTAGAAIYANRHYLELFRRTRPERLARNHDGEEEQERPKIVENVFIHHGAKIHPEALVSTNGSTVLLAYCDSCLDYFRIFTTVEIGYYD